VGEVVDRADRLGGRGGVLDDGGVVEGALLDRRLAHDADPPAVPVSDPGR
jgi:hypothetical protein